MTVGVGFWLWLEDELATLRGRPFASAVISLDQPTGNWIDVTFASGPNRQYTAAQVFAFAANRYPGIWASEQEMLDAIWAAFANWVKADGTPPPEGGWPEADRPRTVTVVG